MTRAERIEELKWELGYRRDNLRLYGHEATLPGEYQRVEKQLNDMADAIKALESEENDE